MEDNMVPAHDPSPAPTSGDKLLLEKSRQLEDTWKKLLHVRWSRDAFAALGHQARELAQLARSQEQTGFLELVQQFQTLVAEHVNANQMPRGQARERLEVLLDGIIRLQGGQTGTVSAPAGGGTPQRAVRAEVMVLVGMPDGGPLAQKLRDAGFRTRHLHDMPSVRGAFNQTLPVALVVDVDFGGEPLSGIGLVAQFKVRYNLDVPVFFLAEHGDISTRLEAVQAGGSGYFTRPVDVPALLEKLNDRLFHESARGYRVLIVNDRLDEFRFMSQALETRGIVTRGVERPLDVLKETNAFQPDLILMDLDLREVSGLDLARVLRQHQDYDSLPLVLLSSQADVGRHLSALGAGGDDLLTKPVDSDYLFSAVSFRLRRARVLNARLSALAQRDATSGLYNRRHFLDHLERLGAGLGITTRSLAVVLIMLDNLRALRDSTDVATADQVVERAARRLRGVLGRDYRPARFGDAFFAVLVPNQDEGPLRSLARTMRQALEADPYEVGSRSLLLRVCIGVCLAEKPEDDFQTLIQHADLACSVAREQGGERIHIHNPQVDREVKESHSRRLLKEIRDAIEHERMGLVFQPIVSLRGDQAERYEVFLRMRDSQDQELLPESVFGVAQQHRLGVALDRWVTARSIRVLREHQTSGRDTLLFINLSPATFKDATFSNWLQGRLAQAQVRAASLIFEVSETMAEEHLGVLRDFVKDLKDLGCGFSVERFGRRSDSVGLLRVLPADYVKLDAHFVQSLVSNTTRQEQLKRLVEHLAALKATTIVGGIENLYTLPVLWSCGINYVQGYFLQRPHKDMSYDFSSGAI